jgi:FkbM family methyltransferase
MKFKFTAWCSKWINRLGGPAPYQLQARGIIHVGGNLGQERFLYEDYGLNVAWVEPLPNMFDKLSENVRSFPKQRAFRYLITDKDGQEYQFHIANNEGQSSSILDLGKHKEMWPEIAFKDSMVLVSSTLTTFVAGEKLDLDEYDALVLDAQGAEMLILKGGKEILSRFRFITVEVPDFEAYQGCCLLSDMDEFMKNEGFHSRERNVLKSVPKVGTYYDVTYERNRRN